VPFRTFEWEDGELKLGRQTPDPELRQTDETSFVILKSFCYRVPRRDPDRGTVYIVPGADTGSSPKTRELTLPEDDGKPSRRVVVPPNNGGVTDLASVPSFMWWLIASYGNHTRAVLLHDALYVDKGEPPVPRKTADRLLLTALREPGQKAGAFRHWLMWAAVSAFGTMRHRLGILFALHALAVWVLVIGALAWEWGRAVSWSLWQVAVAVLVSLAFLTLLGTSWRALVDVRHGWLLPTSLLAGLTFLPLALEWPRPFELGWSPFTLLVVTAVLMVLGPLWGLWVDPTLRGWLWPTTVIGLPIAMLPVILIFVSVRLVWFIDLGAALAAAPRKDQRGERRGIVIPSVRPTRAPL
jgi:Protein of unknown function (DUF1353)